MAAKTNTHPANRNQEDSLDPQQLSLPGVVPKTPNKTAPMSVHLSRTPLFAPRKRGERGLVNDQLLASPEGMSVRYTGLELDMADQDVFLMALRLAAGVGPNTAIKINRADFLRELGRKSLSNAQYAWLEQAFFRLAKATLILQTPKYKIGLRLLGDLELDKETGEYNYSIPERTLGLFVNEAYSYLDLEQRKAFEKRIDLAKWLQAYATSHKPGEHSITLAKLRAWCGYADRLHKFREALSEALDELKKVGLIERWEFYNENKSVKWFRSRPAPRSLANVKIPSPGN